MRRVSLCEDKFHSLSPKVPRGERRVLVIPLISLVHDRAPLDLTVVCARFRWSCLSRPVDCGDAAPKFVRPFAARRKNRGEAGWERRTPTSGGVGPTTITSIRVGGPSRRRLPDLRAGAVTTRGALDDLVRLAVGEQRRQREGVDRMARTVDLIRADDRSARQRQIANSVERLVPNKFIAIAQAFG